MKFVIVLATLVAVATATGYRTSSRCRIPRLDNGYADGYRYGGLVLNYKYVQFKCKSGYVPSGTCKRQCRGGSWTGSCVCKVALPPANCKVTTVPAQGSVSPSVHQVVKHNSYARYSCRTGYRLNGDSSRKCVNGKLSGSDPTCVALPPANCKVTTVPAHGSVSPSVHQVVKHNSYARYSCHTGYRLVGSASRKCVNGKLSGSDPTCELFKCKVTTRPSNGNVVPAVNGYVNHGQYVTYSCSEGHILSGSSRRQCDSGRLLGSDPTCVPIKCTVTELPENGGSSNYDLGDTVALGDEVDYFCKPGFELEGSSSADCGLDGELSNDMPNCIPVTCVVIDLPANGGIRNYDLGDEVQVGDEIDYFCNPGFVLNGQSSIECGLNGEFLDRVPICIPVQCPVTRDDVPVYGTSSPGVGANVAVGKYLLYKCNDGFYLDGKDQVKCEINGQFSDEPPTCRKEQCVVPGAAHKGSISPAKGTRIDVGEYVRFHCFDGYKLAGPDKAQCIAKDTFSDPVTQCVPDYKSCKRPNFYSPGSSFVFKPDQAEYQHNQAIDITCASGQIRGGNYRGVIITTCVDGQWKPLVRPTCMFSY